MHLKKLFKFYPFEVLLFFFETFKKMLPAKHDRIFYVQKVRIIIWKKKGVRVIIFMYAH